MDVSITIPENIVNHIKVMEDIPRFAKEAFTIEAYRNGVITGAEVQEILNLKNRFEVDSFLKKAKAYIDYTEQDLQADIKAIKKIKS